MRLITVSNLFPTPPNPTRGLYNAQLFQEMAEEVGSQELRGVGQSQFSNVCLVPEWRVWRWPEIRRWGAPRKTEDCRLKTADCRLKTEDQGSKTLDLGPWNTDHRPSSGNTPHPHPLPQGEREKSGKGATLTPSPLRGEGWGEGVYRQETIQTVYLPVFYFPLIGRSLNGWFYYRALRNFFLKSNVYGLKSKVFPSPSPPTLYGSWLYPDGVAVATLARELKLPYWLMALGSDTFHLRARARRRAVVEACRGAAGVICVADVLADRLAKAGVPGGKLHVVPNGVDGELFRYRSKEEAWGRVERLKTTDCRLQTEDGRRKTAEVVETPSPLRGEGGGEGAGAPVHAAEIPQSEVCSLLSAVSSSSPLILFVGNLVPVKGPDVMLEAFAAFKAAAGRTQAAITPSPLRGEGWGEGAVSKSVVRRPSSVVLPPLPAPVPSSTPRLVVIGSGPMRRGLERAAQRLGIADSVHFLGSRPHAEVALWMNAADVLCLPSRNEGMPNVVLEARASGLPVVATPAGACPEVPLDKACFLVTDSCSGKAIADGLRQILERRAATRTPDPVVPTWRQQAKTIVTLLQNPVVNL